MTITDTINAQVKSLVEDVKALPETFKKVDVAELRAQAQGFAQTALGQATGVYAELTKKGEELVAKARGLKVEGVKADAQKAAADLKDKAEVISGDVKVKAEELVADAKATVNKVTGKVPAGKPVATKPAAKKAPAKPAATKPAAKKAPVKKA